MRAMMQAAAIEEREGVVRLSEDELADRFWKDLPSALR